MLRNTRPDPLNPATIFPDSLQDGHVQMIVDGMGNHFSNNLSR